MKERRFRRVGEGKRRKGLRERKERISGRGKEEAEGSKRKGRGGG